MFICWHKLCLTLLEIELMNELKLLVAMIAFNRISCILSYWLNGCYFPFASGVPVGVQLFMRYQGP
jgi:ABC-type arginine/histidine transport system permease subunit